MTDAKSGSVPGRRGLLMAVAVGGAVPLAWPYVALDAGLSRLDVRNGAHLVVLAYETGLVRPNRFR